MARADGENSADDSLLDSTRDDALQNTSKQQQPVENVQRLQSDRLDRLS